MKHKRKLPEDGCLKPLSSPNFSTPCNIMIIRVPDEMKGPGEMTYQLATLDRNKEGIEHSADKHVDKLIPNLPHVNAPKENRSELKNTTDTSNTYFRRRRIKCLNKKTADQEETFHPVKNEKIIEQQKSSIDINPWIQKPWENQFQGFYSEINPIQSTDGYVSNSYNPVVSGSIYNQYGSSSYNSYKNNYSDIRSGRVSSNLYRNHRANWKKRKEPLNSSVSEAFASSSDISSFMTNPPPHNDLSYEASTSTVSLNENFVRYQRENVTSKSMFNKKMFPRKNRGNFRRTYPRDSNFNRNSWFRYKNKYESGNHEEISNQDVSNNSYENQKGSGIYDKYDTYTEVSCKDMCVRTSVENRIEESPAVTSGAGSLSTNEHFKKKRGDFSNTSKFTASRNIGPVRFKNKLAFFRNSKTSERNFYTRKSYNQGEEKQNIFPGRYNNRGRQHVRGRGNFMN